MDNRRDEFDFANQYLVGDEYILWKGQPERGSLLTKMDFFLIPFSIFWASFVLVALISSLSEGDPFTMLFLIPFVCVGAYITVGRFIHASVRRKQTRYVITNKKIIRKIGHKTDAREGMSSSFFMTYQPTPIVIQSEAKNLENIHVNVLVYVIEILPPFGRLNDK